MSATIYEEIGGQRAVEVVVEDFYRRVLDDQRLARHFERADLHRLKAHQRAFITAALGGANRYEGRGMYEAHQHLDISGAEFDLVVAHLAETLRDAGVDGALIGKIASELLPLKGEIVKA